MATLNGLPVFNIKINEELENKTGIDFISLVDCPAIESNWVAMAEKKPLKFTTDSDKQILLGPILIPDKPIYRYDEKLGEYYVVFKKEEIEKLVRKFQATQKSINLNYQHQKDSQLQKAVVQEIWLTGQNDKSKDHGFTEPEGSAFVVAHIGDKKFWDEEVKTGKVLGFSIEGFLDMELKKIPMNKLLKLEIHKQADGGCDVFIDGEVKVDSYVYSNWPSVTLVNGVRTETKYPYWGDIVVLEDGKILTLKDSKIIKVEDKQTMSSQKFITAKTDKGVEITCDGETFATGSEVYTMQDGNKSALADGEYKLENGTTLKVSAGKITEITEEELNAEEVAIIQKAMKPIFDKMEARIKELETKLSQTPGAPSATTPTSTPKVEPAATTSPRKTLLRKLEVLRKKDKEVSQTKPTA